MARGGEARLQGSPPPRLAPDPCWPALPRGQSVQEGGFNLESERWLPGASSARCASSRTNWNLLPPPHCRAERSQAPLPRPAPRPHSGPPQRPLWAPAPPCTRSPSERASERACRAGGGGAARLSLARPPPAGGARPRASRRVGAAPAAPAPAERPRPPPGPASAPWRPRKRCCRPQASRAPRAPSGPQSLRRAAPPPPPNTRFPPGRVAGFRLSRPGHMARSTTPSDSVPAKSSVFSTTSTFRRGWFSAFPGRSPRGPGRSSKAGAGVRPAPGRPQPS